MLVQLVIPLHQGIQLLVLHPPLMLHKLQVHLKPVTVQPQLQKDHQVQAQVIHQVLT